MTSWISSGLRQRGATDAGRNRIMTEAARDRRIHGATKPEQHDRDGLQSVARDDSEQLGAEACEPGSDRGAQVGKPASRSRRGRSAELDAAVLPGLIVASGLVPRPIAVLGLIGGTLAFTAGTLELFQVFRRSPGRPSS